MKYFAVICCVLFALGCGGAGDGVVNGNSNRSSSAVGMEAPKENVAATPPAAEPGSPKDEAASDEKAFEGTAGITARKSDAGGVATLSDVRSARHESFDRVVFEFSEASLPGYHIEYIDKPVRACGSGDVVPLAGDGWLEVRFSAARAHTEEGEPTIKDRSRSPNLPIVKDLKLTCDFEAEVTWVMGVSSPNRYRVLELKNPTRLVIDIRHK